MNFIKKEYQRIEEKYKIINKLDIIKLPEIEDKCLGLTFFPSINNTYTNKNLLNFIYKLYTYTNIIYKTPQYINNESNRLHLSILNLSTFESSNEIYNLYKEDIIYNKIIKEILSNVKSFKLILFGCILTNNSIILKGFPDYDINLIRDNIRNKFNDNELIFYERYKNTIFHMTLCRFDRVLTNKELLHLKFLVEKYSNSYFGYFVIDNIVLSNTTLTCRFVDTEILDKFIL